MDVSLTAINESQWIVCLLQITGLMTISWLVGRIALHKFPDISASVGVVALTVSAGLIVFTWAGVPRPFELTVSEAAKTSPYVEPSHPSVEHLESNVESELSAAPWFSNLASMINWTSASNSQNATAESTWQLVTPIRIVNALLLLTLLGGLVGVFRVIHSSIAIYRLSRFSTLVEEPPIRSEVKRILALLPISHQHQGISVRQFKELGSPFVSWLTGSTIFVPESFLNWSASEQSASLAHEIGHLQRRDHFCRLITQLTFCLTWLHPLAWLLHRQFVLAQELAADQVAAQATENPSAYCRGLSRLALRFDAQCRHSSALGVSVSSSLIRRITMLNGITYRLPCSRLVNRCITLFAFIACTGIGCWSVSGQTTTQEEQPDSKVITASHTTPVEMFSQPTTAPWEEEIGNQSGYYKVQVSRILNHPYLKKQYRPVIAAALDSALRSEPGETPSLKQFGLSLSDITQIQGGIHVFLNHDPDTPGGHRSSIGLGASKTKVTAANPVDWPEVINAFDFEKLAYIGVQPGLDPLSPPNFFEKVRESWMESAETSCSNVFEVEWSLIKNDSVQGFNLKPTETKKAIWEAVSGGVTTVVYDIVWSGKVPADYKEADALNQAHLEMTIATETVAWGIDLSQDYKTCQIRFAAVPKEGVSVGDLLKKFEALRDAFIQSDADEEFPEHFLEQFMKAKVTIVKSKNSNGETVKSYLLVEGECSADLSKFDL